MHYFDYLWKDAKIMLASSLKGFPLPNTSVLPDFSFRQLIFICVLILLSYQYSWETVVFTLDMKEMTITC